MPKPKDMKPIKSWKLWQIDDVKNAFLHGELDQEVYMKQPKRFEGKALPDNVCKLRRTLYRLKQAPREWYNDNGEIGRESVLRGSVRNQH